jgi:hypothetical protein
MRRRLGKYVLGALAVLSVWTMFLAGMAFVSAAGSNVAVFAPPGRAAEVAVAAGGSLEEFSSMLAITRSDEAGFVGRLYSNGAFLVIDARVVAGCRAAFRGGRRTLGLE